MAFTKIESGAIEAGAVSVADIADASITLNKLHTEVVPSIIADMTDSAPVTLDTLNELAAALGDDPNFATTVTNTLATKAPLASPSFTGNVGIGTDSPVTKLSIFGDASRSTDLYGDHVAIRLNSTEGGWRTGYAFDNSSSSELGGLFAFGNSQSMTHMTIDVSGSERLRIDDGGQVFTSSYHTGISQDTRNMFVGGLTAIRGTTGQSGKQNYHTGIQFNAVPTGSGSDKYIYPTTEGNADFTPARYSQLQGQHIWYHGPSATASSGDQISWSESGRFNQDGTFSVAKRKYCSYRFFWYGLLRDGESAVVFYNSSSYSRAIVRLHYQSSHGSIGWSYEEWQISRYGGNQLQYNESMNYLTTGFYQNPNNSTENGIRITRSGGGSTYTNVGATCYVEVIFTGGYGGVTFPSNDHLVEWDATGYEMMSRGI